ncbi:MAG: peroxidase [Chloroflexi bacterium]|nr:peroxidase [Chloroflexota bacterium]
MQAIKTDFRTAPIDAATRAMLAYAEKATRNAHAMTPRDLDGLRAHGFSDEDILDIVHVMAYFNYINRVADSLGVDGEPGFEALERVSPRRAHALAEARTQSE